MMGTKAALAATHYPQTDGQSERGVRELTRLVRTYAAAVPEEWASLLPLLEIAWNRAPNTTTKFSPYKALFGRRFRSSLHWLRWCEWEEPAEVGQTLDLKERNESVLTNWAN